MKRLPVANSRQSGRAAAGLMRHHWLALTGVTAVRLAGAATGVMIPRIVGKIVNLVTSASATIPTSVLSSQVTTLVVWALVLTGVGMVCTGLGEWSARVLGQIIFAQLREDLLAKITGLPLGVIEAAGTGDLLGRTQHDLRSLQFVIQRGIARLMTLAVTLVVTLAAATITAPLLSLAIWLPLLACIPAVRWYLHYAVPAYRTVGSQYATIDGVIAESIDQIDTVSAFNLGARRSHYLFTRTKELFAVDIYAGALRGKAFFWLNIFTLLSPLAVLVWGLYLHQHQLVDLNLRVPVFDLIVWLDEVQSATVAFGRIVGVELVPTETETTDELPEDNRIKVRDVSYAYREGHPVLHHIDLDLVPGERLAIVGPSGSGKSTLGRMLAGIHPPTSGSVTLGGVEVSQLPEHVLHQEISLVTQEHHVFAATLGENLRLAAAEASDSQLWQALDAIGATWAHELEAGLDTPVGSGGHALSPAQAQQLALARIALINPHTLILDENALGSLMAGRTVVAIAHRLYTAADADRIAVVIDGRIAELGSHTELLARKGHYANLWNAWQSE